MAALLIRAPTRMGELNMDRCGKLRTKAVEVLRVGRRDAVFPERPICAVYLELAFYTSGSHFGRSDARSRI